MMSDHLQIFGFTMVLLMLMGEKMSKSIGNIKLVHELIKEYKGEVLRMTLLSAHYRQPLNWNKDIIKQNGTMLDRLYRALKELENIDAYANSNTNFNQSY